jgi:hypothetical protein
VTVARRTDRYPRARAAAAACIGALLLGPSSARAQSEDLAIHFEDFGFTALPDPAARANAISAPAALVSDVTALVYNPAGLSRVKRRNASVSYGWRAQDYDYTFRGDSQTSTADASGLGFAGVAFPIPVLRGSLVPAASVHRAFSSERVLRYSGFNVPDGRDDTYLLQQSGATYAYTLGVSVDVSGVFSLGGALSFLDGDIDLLRQYQTQPHVPQPQTRTFVLDSAQLQVTGVVGSVGLEVYAHRHLQLAVVLTSRQPLDVSGTRVQETTIQVDNGVGSFTRETTTTSREYVLPYRLDAALAAPWKTVTVAAQVGYADWAEATIGGHRIRTQSGEDVLRAVVDVRGGVEWSSPVRGLRLRAGAAHARGALAFMQADRVDEDHLEPIASDSGRTRLSLGAGLLIGTRVVVDAAYEHARSERSAESVGDRLETGGVLVQGSYWF